MAAPVPFFPAHLSHKSPEVRISFASAASDHPGEALCGQISSTSEKLCLGQSSHNPTDSRSSFVSVVSGRSDKAVCDQISPATRAPKTKLDPRFPDVKLSARQYGISEGKPVVSFSSAEFAAGTAFFKSSLVAKFSVGRPSISEIRSVLKEHWDFKGRCTLSDIWDGRHILVILDSEADAVTALTSPIRKVGLTTFRLFRYSPDYDPRSEPVTTTKWVRLPGLPPPLFTRSFVEAIVNSFALFLDVDERTKACANLKYARACVEIDVSKSLPEEVIISLPDGCKLTQKVEVEGNLLYCPRCKIHGHHLSDCKRGKPHKEAEFSGKVPIQHEFKTRWIKPGRRFQSDNPKAKRDAPSENRAKAVLVTMQETKARVQASVQEPMMGAIVHEPSENKDWESVNRRNDARPVVPSTEDSSSRVSFQVKGSSSNEGSLPSLDDQNIIPEQGAKEKIQKESGSSYAEVAIPVQHKNEQEWQVAGRKKKGKKPISGHAASATAKYQEREDAALVKRVSLQVETELKRRQREEAEEIIDIRRSVGIISSIPREEEIQSLISYFREGREKGQKGRKGGILLKRGERGVP